MPLQLFRSLIESVLGKQSPEPARSRVKLITEEDIMAPASRQDVVWLKSIQRWLPGTWADADIVDKAVKSDNSPVDFKPWHRRIQLVFPCSTPTMEVFERLATRKWWRNIVRSLFQFISATYGIHWRRNFFLDGKRKLADGLPLSDKRARLSLKTSVSPSTGGKGTATALTNPLIVSDLRVDMSRGLRIIGQVLKSTWWEWTYGSAPLFWRWNGREQMESARDECTSLSTPLFLDLGRE